MTTDTRIDRQRALASHVDAVMGVMLRPFPSEYARRIAADADRVVRWNHDGRDVSLVVGRMGCNLLLMADGMNVQADLAEMLQASILVMTPKADFLAVESAIRAGRLSDPSDVAETAHNAHSAAPGLTMLDVDMFVGGVFSRLMNDCRTPCEAAAGCPCDLARISVLDLLDRLRA